LNNLDHLIDDAAREITERRVDDGFARRVSLRIQDADTGAVRVPRSWSRAWLLAPAAACVALLAVMIVRQGQSPNVRLTTPAKAPVVKKPDATTESATTKTATAPQTATADVRLKPDATTDTTATRDTTATVSDPDLKPLAMAPIELTSLEVSPLVVAMPIEISTIAIERIEIAAMP